MARTVRLDPLGLRAVASHRASLTLLLMLLSVDVAYFVAHVRAASTGIAYSLAYIDEETGHAEAFQSLQWLWALGLLSLIVLVRRRWVLVGLAPLLAFFLLTDRYRLHELAGEAIAAAVGLPPTLGLRPEDVGELLALTVAALLIVPALVLAIRAADLVERRHFARILLIALCILFCGVVLDAVHILVVDDPAPGDAFGLIEDGGEMLGGSILVAYLFRVWLGRGPVAASDRAARSQGG